MPGPREPPHLRIDGLIQPLLLSPLGGLLLNRQFASPEAPVLFILNSFQFRCSEAAFAGSDPGAFLKDCHNLPCRFQRTPDVTTKRRSSGESEPKPIRGHLFAEPSLLSQGSAEKVKHQSTRLELISPITRFSVPGRVRKGGWCHKRAASNDTF